MLLHGRREGVDNRKRSRHMWSDSTSLAVVPGGVGVSSNRVSPRFFFRDGRKISIGDCALFKPAQDRPPFVGIIRSLTSDKESNLTLGVNRLYRTAEVKLLKGVALEAAPNEVFYSFHRDELPAASLLHPCKVAFLRKGAELPTGVASFVCRRVYDITNKCFWWLSDRDFIDERQEEVDNLLKKTSSEMHASVQQQQGPRSPKLPNSSTATSPQKHSPDSVQNSSSNLVSKRKLKKRDKGDQSPEPIKREQSARPDSGRVNSESSLNVEIAKVAERGGLVDSEAVAALVRLMLPESSRRKIDLAGRSMLVEIIATTDNLDYLTQFIQLKGLIVLDEWLQEVHKGKVGDPGNVKDSDKSVENFLLILLRALVKLPVNLNALQMCNIGKSVNYLRSHKNSDIQKRAKSLVDTWKKRVEAEMSINDEKSGYGSGYGQAVPFSGRSKDDSHGIGGYRHSGGSYEAAIRNSVMRHSSLKSSSAKLAQEASNLKFGSAYQNNATPASSRISAIPDCKNGQARISVDGRSSEPLQIVAREEKSSGSSQSHSNSHCSSDHVKPLVPCGKADVKISAAVSKSANKITRKDPKRRKLGKGHNAGVINEAASDKGSLIEQVSHNDTDGLVRVGDVLEGNNHKVSVNVSNSVSGPAQSTVAACAEGFQCRNSRASSPVRSEMLGKSDACLNRKHDSHQTAGVAGSLAADRQTSVDTSRASDVTKDACSTGVNEMKLIEAPNPFRSIDALIETCIRLSEVVVSMSAGDDFGVNLLASVATGDFSNCGIVPLPPFSAPKPSVINANSDVHCTGNEKQVLVDNPIQPEHVSDDVRSDNSNIDSGIFKVNGGESSQNMGNVSEDLHRKENGCMRDNKMSDEHSAIPCTTGRSESHVNDIRGDAEGECCHQLPPRESVASHLKAKRKLKDSSLNDKSKKATHRDTVAVNAIINAHKTVPSQVNEKQEDPGIHCRHTVVDTGCKDEHADNKEAFVCSSGGVLLIELHSSTYEGEHGKNKGEDSGVTTVDTASLPATGDVNAKHWFDLNEGLYEEGKHMEPVNVNAGPCAAMVFPASPLQVPVSSASDAYPTSIAVTTSAKVPFVPSDSLSRSKKEHGWNRLASTNDIHSAKSREMTESPLSPGEAPYPDGAVCRQARPPLDIDLNVADESSGLEPDFGHSSVCEPMTKASLRSSGRLEFDLNETDETSDIVQQPASNSHRIEISTPVKQLSSSNFSNGKASSKRDFDLNDGPAIEEIPIEQTSYNQPFCNNMPLQSSFRPRISPFDAGNFSGWNPRGTNYSVSVSPSTLPDREAFPIAGVSSGFHHIMGAPASSLSFYPDTYRGSVVATSVAMPFQSAPYQYPIFPFGTSCSLPTSALAGGPSGYMDPTVGGRFSAIPSQLVGNATAVSFQYPHAYGIHRPIQEVGNNGVFDSNQRWGKMGLDLNSGPGGVDLEWRNGSIPTMSVSRQVSAINLRPLVKDPPRMCTMGGGVLKRKEPDGGWNVENG